MTTPQTAAAVVDLTAARQQRGQLAPVDADRLDQAVYAIRHDCFTDEDLRVARVSREQAEEYLRRDLLARLARTYDKAMLLEAAKLKDRQSHDPRLDAYLQEAWPTRPEVWA
jgi:hypothetical protein